MSAPPMPQKVDLDGFCKAFCDVHAGDPEWSRGQLVARFPEWAGRGVTHVVLYLTPRYVKSAAVNPRAAMTVGPVGAGCFGTIDEALAYRAPGGEAFASEYMELPRLGEG